MNRDSEVCPFVLTPMRTGSLLVVIELVWEDAERGYRRLKTNCVAEAEMAGSPVMSVVQMPLVVGSPVRTGGYPPRTPLSPRPTVSDYNRPLLFGTDISESTSTA